MNAIIAAVLGSVTTGVFTLIFYFLKRKLNEAPRGGDRRGSPVNCAAELQGSIPKEVKKSLQKEHQIFDDVGDAFNSLLNNLKVENGKIYINKIRIYASKSGTIGNQIFGNNKLNIDECIIMLRKLPKGHELYDENYDKELTVQIEKWKRAKNIRKITIIEYDRISDIWYVIYDDKVLVTDLFAMNFEKNDNIYTSYSIDDSKAIMLAPSCSEANQKYIFRYIKHFDNYENYYKQKGKIIYKR